MILRLYKPIRDINNNYVRTLEYDLYQLTIKDFNNIENLYVNLTGNNTTEYLIPESTLAYKLCVFFISCAKFNKNMSFTEFLKCKGKDKRIIVSLVDRFFMPAELFSKKKDFD